MSPARRDDQPFELTEESTRIPVRRHDDTHGVEAVDRVDARVLVDLDAGSGGALRDASHEPSRLQHTVGRMEERSRVTRERSREILAPLDCEPRVT